MNQSISLFSRKPLLRAMGVCVVLALGVGDLGIKGSGKPEPLWAAAKASDAGGPEKLKILKIAERASAILTGQPLSDEMRARLLGAQGNMDSLTDEILKSETFVRHMGVFWSRVLGVTGQVSLFNQMASGDDRTLFLRARGQFVNFPIGPQNPQPNTQRVQGWINQIKNFATNDAFPLLDGAVACNGFMLLQRSFINMAQLNALLKDGKYSNGDALIAPVSKWQELKNTLLDFQPGCGGVARHVDVQPFWANLGEGSSVWKAARGLTGEKVCGTTFERCFSGNINTLIPHTESRQDLNLEPGYLVAKTVADDLAQATILTTTRTVLSGRLAFVMQKYLDGYGLWDAFPGGRYVGTGSGVWSEPSWSDLGLHWVERGEQHAGVLTTYAFQVSANGRRAKANRAFEALTCSQFTVPEGILPDPADDNPDLRHRTYCSACHRTLEPMAAFFRRWPDTGRVNYEFDGREETEDRGIFRGTEAIGVRGFAALLAESDAFEDCQIQRGFEFVMGRTWTASERSVYLERLRPIYASSDKRLKPVLKALLSEVLQ